MPSAMKRARQLLHAIGAWSLYTCMHEHTALVPLLSRYCTCSSSVRMLQNAAVAHSITAYPPARPVGG
eukprot:9362049-Alexandrium_andersonii.AAC.1